MKKRLFIVSLLLILSTSTVAAFEQGISFSGGLQSSILAKFYTNEGISYKMFFDDDNQYGLSIDFSSTQNLIPTSSSEQIIFFDAGLSVYFNSFYVGGGVFFLKGPEVSGYFKTGYDFGGWEWGPGTGSVYLGLIFSPTLVSFDSDGSTEGNIDAAVGSFFGSLLNMLKIECGVRYYIPF